MNCFMLEVNAIRQVVMPDAGDTFKSERHHRHFKAVARMLMIAPYTKFAAYGIAGVSAAGSSGLVKPVLSGDIIAYKFICKISGSQQCELRSVRRTV